MANKNRSADNYYYAGGKKIALKPARDLLAIDSQAFLDSTLPDNVRKAVEIASKSLAHGVRLVDRKALSRTPNIVKSLTDADLLHPVYRSGKSVLIGLPEVRIEEARGGTHEKLLKQWLTRHADKTSVAHSQYGQITLRPLSGKASDALAMANNIAEEVEPEMVQSNFIRIVPRPSSVMD